MIPPPIIQAGIDALKRGETLHGKSRLVVLAPGACGAFEEALWRGIYSAGRNCHDGRCFGSALSGFSAILNPGDEVIIPTPVLCPIRQRLCWLAANSVEVPTFVEDEFNPRIEDIEAAITNRTRIILSAAPAIPRARSIPVSSWKK